MNMPTRYFFLILFATIFGVGCRDIQDAKDRWGAEEDSIPVVVDLVEPPGLDTMSPPPSPAADEKIPAATDFVLLETEPAPLNLDEIKKEIGYPGMAREAAIEGKVIVRILIDEKGKYMQHVVLKDPHPLLTKAVEKQISALRFSQGILDGKAIKTWVTVPFDFHVNY